jgi:hypothetical protein
MLRSRAPDGFRIVFDARWRGDSKHEAAPSFETLAVLAPQDEGGAAIIN